ncbi:MAG: hypothetical protein CMQ68_00070 [Gammaproteobacteria bacterium]|nr:hypothetical protein [Gammaproteobacteria bacterium]|tara:strand:+ start:19948 stop:20490 length:543 start_codon:yes stop_codon:yes gene_type:complete
MAKTVINLSDPVSTLVTKTNTISNNLGDLGQLNVGASNDSDLVQAINFINNEVKDSATVITIARSGLQKDSANAIGYDSSQGRFFVPSNTINSAMIEDDAITNAKIGNLAVDTAELAAGAVETAKLDDLAVTNAKIANTTIENGKIANNQITSAKFSSAITLLIKDVNGSTLKTIRSPGS